MKILILGGTGAMGLPLIKTLSNDCDNIIYVTSRSEKMNTANVRYIRVDAHDSSAIAEVLEEKFDCIVDFMNYSYLEFKEKYRLLLNSTKHYIFLSSARVYSNKDIAINENDDILLNTSDDKEFISQNEYSLEKAKEENLLRNSEYDNYTILRPYITYNYNRLQLGVYEKEDWLYRALNGQEIVIQKNLLDKKTTMTYSVDVANYISQIVSNKKTLGEVYNITENKMDITWNDILNIYCRCLEKYNIKLNYKLTDDVFDDRKYQLIYDRYYNRVFDDSKINSICKYRIKGTIDEKIEKCIDEFMMNKKFLNCNYKMQAYMDKNLHNFSSLKFIKRAKDKIKYIIYRTVPKRILLRLGK